MTRRGTLMAAVVAGAMALASSVYAESFSTDVSSMWKVSATDNGGTYNVTNPTSVVGGQLRGKMQTSSSQTNTEYDVMNYIRTRSDFGAAASFYNGTLLGNLSGKSAVTATFNLSTSALAAGTPFVLSNFAGDDMNIQAPGIRLVFRGATDLGGGTPNMWWSNSTVAHVTSMNNGQDVTLTVALDPSKWSNYNGHVGTESPTTAAEFAAALSNVSNLGLSFGSGYFFSNGFRFNTGGIGLVQVNSIDTISAVPLPASAWSGLALLGGLAVVKRRKSEVAPA